MKTASLSVALAIVALAAIPSAAQQPIGEPLSAAQIAVACAPPPVLVASRPAGVHVTGAQDTAARTIFDETDLLILDGGTRKGLQLGQLYFVRRPVLSGYRYMRRHGQRAVQTAGWIRIVSATDTGAVAAVVHLCSSLESGDYLEPFAAPALPPNVASSVTTGTLDFTAMGHVLFGDDERMAAAAGDFLLIDRGSDRGVAPGARFAIYRAVRHYIPDLRGLPAPHLPLASVGEATVVSASQSWSVIQVAGARDAVQAGDFVVPRK